MNECFHYYFITVVLFFGVFSGTIHIGGTSQQHAKRAIILNSALAYSRWFFSLERQQSERRRRNAHIKRSRTSFKYFNNAQYGNLDNSPFSFGASRSLAFLPLNSRYKKIVWYFMHFVRDKSSAIYKILDYTFVRKFVMHISMYANFALFKHFLTHKLFSAGFLPRRSLPLFLVMSRYMLFYCLRRQAHAFCLNSFSVALGAVGLCDL